MIAVHNIQATVASQISAHSYISGISVITDDGLQFHNIERALGDKGNGVAIVVSFPTGSAVMDGANNLSAEDFGITVTVRVNAQRNAETNPARPGAQKDLLLLLTAVREAVLSWPTPNQDRLGFRSAGCTFAWEIEGEVGYYADFNIRAAFHKAA